MCNYIYKELFCEHFFFIVDEWCKDYIATQKRCVPVIISKEYWGNEICSACRDKQKPSTHPCARLLKYGQRRSSPPLRRYDTTYCHEYHPSTGLVVTKLKAPWVSREQHQHQQLRHQQQLHKLQQQHKQYQQQHRGGYAIPGKPRSGRAYSSAGAYSSTSQNNPNNGSNSTTTTTTNSNGASTANNQAYPLYVVSPQQNQNSFDRMP